MTVSSLQALVLLHTRKDPGYLFTRGPDGLAPRVSRALPLRDRVTSVSAIPPMSHNRNSQTERSGDERPDTVSIGELLRSTHSTIPHRSIRHLYWSEIAIVQIRASTGTDVGDDDNATSQGLLRRLLSPGSFRRAHVQGDQSTTSPRASRDDDDLIVEDSGSEIQDNDDDYNEDRDMEYSYWGRPFARTPKWFSPVTAPQEAGLRLLMGGEFGRVGVEARSRKGGANFSKTILSSRSKLRQTPKQDITNVCALCL